MKNVLWIALMSESIPVTFSISIFHVTRKLGFSYGYIKKYLIIHFNVSVNIEPSCCEQTKIHEELYNLNEAEIEFSTFVA